jgi:hypothetical protein
VDNQRIMKQGLLVNKQRERDAVEVKIDRCVKDITYYSYAFPTEGVASINPDAVVQAANELKALCLEWKSLSEKIKNLEDQV